MRKIVGIAGTTSVGKSAVAVELAHLLHSEIISADSMQIYKGMDIGTAKISDTEMRGIQHYMLDIVEPNVHYSSFLYQKEASHIIDKMECTPIMVGGTGFYFDSLVYPPEFGGVGESRRAELHRLLDEQGIESLTSLLRELDIDSYNAIDLENAKRVIRAVEIAESGCKMSDGLGRKREPRYDLKLFVLQRSRDSLYQQINLRVDAMIEAGLVDEVKRLVDKYGICDTPAFQAIGYKEIIEYFNDHISLIDAIEKIKLNTRHYAKRQITYFKKMNVMEFINVEGKSALEIASCIKDKLNCGA